uniref:Methyltransferase type 11 domain-containing protein n=1 Tax=Phytophthora ramorum TaxID=164328 RepID=H3H4T9_PHYRM
MASFGLGDDADADADAALYTLAYFTSAWVQPVDALVLPRIREVLDGVNALDKEQQLIGLLEVRREEGRGIDTDAKAQRLEPSTFRSLCKHFHVTDLPACVLLDAQGQALTQGSLKALEVTSFYCCDLRMKMLEALTVCGGQNELRQLHEDDSATSSNASWRILGELLREREAPEAAWQALLQQHPLATTAEESEIASSLKVDDPALVNMREDALQLFESGQLLPAASSFVKVLLRCPACTKSSFNLAVILQTIGETYFAVSCMLRVVALDDSDSVAHTVLRSVYYLEDPDLVSSGYHSIIAKNCDSHVRAVHSLATLEGATTTRTAAPAYVAEVFDELAESFEEKLVAHLEYRVPWQLVEALQKLSPPGLTPKGSISEPEWAVADVGCAADIVPFLESCSDESLDLIISADVWIYVGALEQVFELSTRKLRASTGWMAFSIELLPPKDDANETSVGFRLAPSGRFQHSHEYIMALVRRLGFSVAVQEDISVRKESGVPIPGRIYILQRIAQHE